MIRSLALVGLLLMTSLAAAQVSGDGTPGEGPLRLDTVERATVQLILLDVMVLDRNDRTVPDLEAGDFEIRAGGKWRPIDTLDLRCDDGAIDDPRGVRNVAARVATAAPEGGRRVVLAFDYQHLPQLLRTDALEQARRMIRHGMVDGEEIMLAALTGGLRVEQPFTRDRELILDALKRMEYDITLWNGSFDHQSEVGFVRGLTALLDVAGTVAERKAVVLFSAMGDVPLDSQFEQIAAHAAASRCAIYPVDAMGMRTRLQDLRLERTAAAKLRPG